MDLIRTTESIREALKGRHVDVDDLVRDMLSRCFI